MKRKIQSILYVAFLLIMFLLILKVSKVYENPFSLYENPLVVILVTVLSGVVLIKEYAFYVTHNILKGVREESTTPYSGVLNIFVFALFIIVSVAVLVKANIAYESPFSLYENPLVVLLAIAVSIIILFKEYAFCFISEQLHKEKLIKQGVVIEEKEQWSGLKILIKKLTKSRDISENDKITLDHDYDGIRELDNVLPPWWVYLFYCTILFAVVYLLRFEVFGGKTQIQEYDKSIAEAKIAIAKYKAENPDAFDFEKAELLTEASDIAEGKSIFFSANCIACHAPDGGGGIGPNLTDKHWVLGGGFKNVMHTILNGGREGKGMIAWKASLKPEEIQKVASFVISLQGTKPASPKAPEGDIWKEK